MGGGVDPIPRHFMVKGEGRIDLQCWIVHADVALCLIELVNIV